MKISCVICAYNEAPRIGQVLSIAAGHPLLDEVIVVDDGSTDGTATVVRSFPSVQLLVCPTNQGKSRAIASGVAAAKNDLLMLLDADLKNLTSADIDLLARPVLSGVADVTMSVRKNSLFIYRLIGLDFVSGERVLPKKVLSEALGEVQRLPRFGIEVFTNKRILAANLRLATVRWDHVTQARKTEKLGWWKGTQAEFRMVLEVFRVIYPLAAVVQTYHLLRSRTGTRFSRKMVADASHE